MGELVGVALPCKHDVTACLSCLRHDLAPTGLSVGGGSIVLAKDAYERLLLWSARTLEGYYQLAGEHELAERIFPATRRLGRPASPRTPDTPEEATPDSPWEEETEGSEPEDREAEDPDSEGPDAENPDPGNPLQANA